MAGAPIQGRRESVPGGLTAAVQAADTLDGHPPATSDTGFFEFPLWCWGESYHRPAGEADVRMDTRVEYGTDGLRFRFAAK